MPSERVATLLKKYMAKAEEAGLDPVRTLVDLQKHMQVHRGLSSMVLSGNLAAEADRLYRLALSADPEHVASAVGLLGLLYDEQRYPEMRAVAAPFLTRGYATRQAHPRCDWRLAFVTACPNWLCVAFCSR